MVQSERCADGSCRIGGSQQIKRVVLVPIIPIHFLRAMKIWLRYDTTSSSPGKLVFVSCLFFFFIDKIVWFHNNIKKKHTHTQYTSHTRDGDSCSRIGLLLFLSNRKKLCVKVKLKWKRKKTAILTTADGIVLLLTKTTTFVLTSRTRREAVRNTTRLPCAFPLGYRLMRARCSSTINTTQWVLRLNISSQYCKL